MRESNTHKKRKCRQQRSIGAGGGAFPTRNALSIKTTSPSHFQKTLFQGQSIQDAKRVGSICFTHKTSLVVGVRRSGRGLDHTIKARKTTGSLKQIEVEVDKPLGLTLGPKPGTGGGGVITVISL